MRDGAYITEHGQGTSIPRTSDHVPRGGAQHTNPATPPPHPISYTWQQQTLPESDAQFVAQRHPTKYDTVVELALDQVGQPAHRSMRPRLMEKLGGSWPLRVGCAGSVVGRGGVSQSGAAKPVSCTHHANSRRSANDLLLHHVLYKFHSPLLQRHVAIVLHHVPHPRISAPGQHVIDWHSVLR